MFVYKNGLSYGNFEFGKTILNILKKLLWPAKIFITQPIFKISSIFFLEAH